MKTDKSLCVGRHLLNVKERECRRVRGQDVWNLMKGRLKSHSLKGVLSVGKIVAYVFQESLYPLSSQGWHFTSLLCWWHSIYHLYPSFDMYEMCMADIVFWMATFLGRASFVYNQANDPECSWMTCLQCLPYSPSLYYGLIDPSPLKFEEWPASKWSVLAPGYWNEISLAVWRFEPKTTKQKIHYMAKCCGSSPNWCHKGWSVRNWVTCTDPWPHPHWTLSFGTPVLLPRPH